MMDYISKLIKLAAPPNRSVDYGSVEEIMNKSYIMAISIVRFIIRNPAQKIKFQAFEFKSNSFVFKDYFCWIFNSWL